MRANTEETTAMVKKRTRKIDAQIEREVHEALTLAWKQTKPIRDREAEAERGIGSLKRIVLR
jgi:hypothetical protein